MIRNVCIHATNDQPLLCDLFDMPSADDAGLVCTNVRTLDGKRPVFIDATASTFFFPYHVVRFLEIPEASMAQWRAAGGRPLGASARGAGSGGHADDDGATAFEPDGTNGAYEADGSLLPIAVGAPDASPDGDLDVDLEIDEDFLQRVRDL